MGEHGVSGRVSMEYLGLVSMVYLGWVSTECLGRVSTEYQGFVITEYLGCEQKMIIINGVLLMRTFIVITTKLAIAITPGGIDYQERGVEHHKMIPNHLSEKVTLAVSDVRGE